jgi:hypothetical protein
MTEDENADFFNKDADNAEDEAVSEDVEEDDDDDDDDDDDIFIVLESPCWCNWRYLPENPSAERERGLAALEKMRMC